MNPRAEGKVNSRMPIETPSISLIAHHDSALNHVYDSARADSPAGGDNLGQTKKENPRAEEKANSRVPIETSSIYERPVSVIAPNHSPDISREDSPGEEENLGQRKG